MTVRILFFLLFAFSGTKLFAQIVPGQEFSGFVKANEKFGRKLLHEAHALSPEQNVAVSPSLFP